MSKFQTRPNTNLASTSISNDSSRKRLVEKIREEDGKKPESWVALVDYDQEQGRLPYVKIRAIMESAIVTVPLPNISNDKTFVDDYIAMWEKYADVLKHESIEKVREIFDGLKNNQSLIKNAYFYVTWGHVESSRQQLDMAKEVLSRGMELNAQPPGPLERAWKKLRGLTVHVTAQNTASNQNTKNTTPFDKENNFPQNIPNKNFYDKENINNINYSDPHNGMSGVSSVKPQPNVTRVSVQNTVPRKPLQGLMEKRPLGLGKKIRGTAVRVLKQEDPNQDLTMDPVLDSPSVSDSSEPSHINTNLDNHFMGITNNDEGGSGVDEGGGVSYQQSTMSPTSPYKAEDTNNERITTKKKVVKSQSASNVRSPPPKTPSSVQVPLPPHASRRSAPRPKTSVPAVAPSTGPHSTTRKVPTPISQVSSDARKTNVPRDQRAIPATRSHGRLLHGPVSGTPPMLTGEGTEAVKGERGSEAGIFLTPIHKPIDNHLFAPAARGTPMTNLDSYAAHKIINLDQINPVIRRTPGTNLESLVPPRATPPNFEQFNPVPRATPPNLEQINPVTRATPANIAVSAPIARDTPKNLEYAIPASSPAIEPIPALTPVLNPVYTPSAPALTPVLNPSSVPVPSQSTPSEQQVSHMVPYTPVQKQTLREIPQPYECLYFRKNISISDWSNEVVFVNGKAYWKLSILGKGGSSEVFKVIGEDKNVYALKQVEMGGLDDLSKKQFLDEIKLLERLKDYECIITLIDSELSQKFLYIVLECGEIDLAGILARHKNGLIDHENRLRLYWQQMLEAVAVVHDKERIVHGDLKPQNFVYVKGYLKLIDFGIAKAIRGNTTNIQREIWAGTLNYSAPESLNSVFTEDSKCSRKADIWSLGCILYQMVYGKPPFSNEGLLTLPNILKWVASPNQKFNLRPINGKPLPPELADVIYSCLQRDPKKRPNINDLLLNDPFLHPMMGIPKNK